MGVNVTDGELVAASNLHNKEEMQQRMEGEAKQAKEAQDLQVKMAMNQQDAMTKSVDAKSKSDLSLAAERFAKIELDHALNAERISRAEEERTAGVLNLIKAAKELRGMDLDQLMIQVQMLKELEEGQRAEETRNEPSNTPAQSRQ